MTLAAWPLLAAVMAPPTIDISTTLDMGMDRGQNYGTLFEYRDNQGRPIAGAGFAAVYNTRFRMDRHALQFYVRPRSESDQFKLERLPKANDNCGSYAFDLDGSFHCWSQQKDRAIKSYQRYLELSPNGPEASVAERYIKELSGTPE